MIIAFLFLASSILLPLGDFSLMKDLPEMYHNYTNISSPEEAGLVDFIGDYLFHGKEFLGHNQHNKIPAKGNEVQFQHQASPLNVVLLNTHFALMVANEDFTDHPLFNKLIRTSNYLNELFRPPLA
jgi:hypothetical protein